MNSYDAWGKALRETEIIRSRVQSLKTFEDTVVPYVFLAESSVNPGDTVKRSGEVVVEKPALILPPHIPQFDGFDFAGESGIDENSVVNFLLVRGINMPSLRYSNTTSDLSIFEGGLDQAVKFNLNHLQQRENVHTGLITGPEDCWQFSILIYICSQVVRNVGADIQRLLAEYRKKQD